METSKGFTIRPAHIQSSSGDFCSLRVERTGSLSIGIYPINSDELRQLAGELLAVAMQIDNATADNVRHREAVDALEVAA